MVIEVKENLKIHCAFGFIHIYFSQYLKIQCAFGFIHIFFSRYSISDFC